MDGTVTTDTVDGLRRARAAGLRLILVTGRELADLFNTFDEPELFDLIVGENGAVVFSPATGRVTVLADAPPTPLLEALTKASVPFSAGHSIIATVETYHQQLVRAIAAGGYLWQVIANKGSIMALPDGVSKRSGLLQALAALGLDPARTISIGDAENDVAMLQLCGLSVAVNNALPSVKAISHIITTQDRGEGVVEFIDRILAERFRPPGVP